ncbi:MAG: hypothetical protein AAF628_30265, partial [Planctomycetota bacterium]
DYNAFVTTDANNVEDLRSMNTTWSAIASSEAVSALDNTGTHYSAAGATGVPIYRVDGVRVANDYGQLWNATGNHLAPIDLTGSGQNALALGYFEAWTGTTPDGGFYFPLGKPTSQRESGIGLVGATDRFWNFANERRWQFETRPLYAISAIITVPLQSAEVVRLGTPPNPQAFLPGVTSPPIVGQTWDPRIDHTSFVPGATADFALLSGSSTNVPLGPLGTLLCDLTAHVVVQSPTTGQPFAVPIPNDQQLVGASLCVQGLSIDTSAGPHLANALDITIGTF